MVNKDKKAFRTIKTSALFCALILFFTASALPAFGAGGDIIWQTRDAKSGKQEAKVSITDSDGNVIITGYQNMSGDTNNDYYTVKFRADGTIAWTAVYDKAGASDIATAVAVSLDSFGDVIVTGNAWNGLHYDIHTIKYDGDTGAVLWQHSYGGASNGNDYATSVAVDTLNNIYVAGYVQSASGDDDCVIIKYSSQYPDYPAVSVAPVWVETFGTSAAGSEDRILSIASGASGIAVTGYSWNGADFDYITRKYGFDKTLVWEKKYGGSGDDRASFVKVDGSENVVVSGYSSNASDRDFATVKYDGSAGTVIWEKVYNGGNDDEPSGLWVAQTGEAYVTGFTWNVTGRYDFYTAKYEAATGSNVWERIFNSENGNDDIPTGIVLDISGDVFVTGYSYKDATANFDFLTIKYREEDGAQLWQAGFDGPAHKDDKPLGIGVSSAGDIFVAGWSDNWTSGSADYDYYVIKYDPGLLNAPSGLTATATSNTEVLLSWTDNSDNEDVFDIWRKQGESGIYAKIASVGSNIATYTDSGLLPDNYYYYKVRAVNSVNGNSHFSNETHVLTRVVNYRQPAWTFLYNHPDNGDDYVSAIAAGPDDDPVATGYSFSGIGGFDYYTVKLNRTDASVIWSERYDDVDSEQDVATCVTVDHDNNVAVSGFSSLYGGGEMNTNDVYTIKYQSGGTPELWHSQYNGPSGSDDRSTAVATTVDGTDNIGVVGYGKNTLNNDDIYVLKYPASPSLDLYGNAAPVWAAVPYDRGGNDYPSAIVFDAAGNIFVAGYSHNGSNYDFFTAKYDSATGVRLWTDIVNGPGNGNDFAKSLAVDSSGNIYVTGYMVNASGNEDFYTIKYNGSTGSRIWEQSCDGPGHGNDEAASIRIDPIDGAVVIAGTSLTSAGNNDFHVLRYSAADGTLLWERNFERHDNDDYVSAMEIDASGYIYIAGTTNNGANTDILSIIYDYEGTFLDAMLFDGSASSDDAANSVTVNHRGEAFIAGYSRNTSGNADYAVLKQANSFILVPAPLTLSPQPDYSRINLAWGDNTPGASFRIERTIAPSGPSSVWTLITTASPGTTIYQDTGLNPGTGYCYRIEAFSGTLTSRKIEACVTTTLGAPTLDIPVVVSTTQIDLSWNNVAGNMGYKIERKTGGGAWGDLATTAADVNTYSDPGLTPGTVYTYRVSVLSASGYSAPGNERQTVTRPSAPSLNNPSNITTVSMYFTWASVTGASSYSLEYRDSTGSYAPFGACTGISGTSCTVTGLTPATQYFFRVKAANSSGDSAWSNEVSNFTLPPTPSLSGVTRAPDCSNNAAAITWNDVSGETGYYVEYAYCNQSNSNPSACATNSWYWNGFYSAGTTGQDVATLSYTMVPGRAYRFRVSSTVNGGVTRSAASSEGAVWACMASPVQNDISPVSNTSLLVSWGDIEGNTNYDVMRKTGADGSYSTITTVGAMANSFTDTGLAEGETYCYKIRAYNTTNLAGLTAPTEVFSNEKCKETPPAAPNPVTLSGVTSSQITISWTKTSEQYTGYLIERIVNSRDDPQNDGNASYWGNWSQLIGGNVVADYDFENTSTSWTGWVGTTAGTSFDTSMYYSGAKSFKLTASGSTLGRYQNVTVKPGAQYVLSGYLNTSLTTAGTAQCDVWGTGIDTPGISIAWNSANNNAGWVYLTEAVTIPASISSVRVRCFADGYPQGTANFDLIKLTSLSDPDVTTFTDTGLTAGYGYKYRVRASYGAGLYTAYSEEKYSRTVPATPVVSAVTPLSTSRIDVSWNNVIGNTGFRLDWKEKTDGDCTAGTWNTVDQGEYVYSYSSIGLTEGTTYCYRIMSYNGSGDSAYSAATFRMTLLSPPVLNSPTNITTSSMDLSWSRVTGNAGYRVERKTGAGGTYAQVATTGNNAETYTDTGLKSGELYFYRISSKNADGYYSATGSNEQSARTTPGQPVVSLSVPSPSQITLSWPVIYGATNYKIQRKAGQGGTYSQISDIALAYQELFCNQPYPSVGCTSPTPVTATFSDGSLIEGSDYCYQVTAYSADSRDSSPSVEQCALTSDIAKPSLTASPLNSMTVRLDWIYDPSVCTPQPCRSDIDGVELEVKLANGLWTRIAVMGQGDTSFVDHIGINPDTRYAYRARAFKGASMSAYSDEASVTTPPYAAGHSTCQQE